VSVVFASIWPVPGIVCGLPTGLAWGPPPGVMPGRPAVLVSAVHADEDHNDQHEDDQHERRGTGEVMTRPAHEDRDTSRH
jgi:hypothetical protein